ncbi:TPA: tape measure protein [Klebsiella pneumoniae]|uniref:tape measure protein n=1 Tax=Klebsiella pneumoniae TaxID=573 RepID=UPI0019BFEFD6|nr:tape measure protein [Klebsiella pneumoniae]MBD7587306.1 tape measure protein [Klebsiella pneumoniae]MCF1353831.1 tape measure protein [Klebsiella pneumoniae]MCF1356599.1 tape measure protein [Klebsiella pneumoniae]HBV5855721.1 tape measure protein [Klebsiella pneumoniae]HBV7742399.1 tape measure protein [Klebsiella pneumoniae]
MAGTFDAGSVIYEVDMDTSRLLAARREVDAALNGLNGSMGRLEASVNRTERSIGSMERTMSSLSGVAKGLLAALSVQQVASYADAWTELNNKVANSVRTGETQAEVMQRIFDVSQATQSSLNGTATLYARLERGTRTYNTSAEDLTRLTTIINQGFAVSGATAQEAENAIIQLSQGIASGVLRGEEFNSVSEQGSRLMVALADSMGVSIGQLRAMAAQGQLTTDVVVKGLLSQGDAIGKEFANTTVSIAKGLQVAGNNVTKFFGENSTVKSFAAGFRDSVITISENLETLSSVLLVVAGIMGSRYAGALAMATSAKVSDIAASRQQLLAEKQQSQAALIAANSAQRKALADKEAALSSLALAQAEYNVAKGSAAEMLALDALIAAKTRATMASATLAEAELAQAAASTTAATAARAASVGIGLAGKALSLIGGPAGAAMLAAAAIFYFWQKAQQAKEEALKFADSLDQVNKSIVAMNNSQLRGTIADANKSIRAQEEEVTKLEESVKTLTERYSNFTPEAEEAAKRMGMGTNYAAEQKDVFDELNQKTRDLSNARDKLSKTTDTASEAIRTLNNNMLTAMGVHEQLIQKGWSLEQVQGAVAKAFGLTADEINRANQAGQNFNPKALQVSPPTADGDKVILNLEEQNELLKIQDERQRAVTKARMQAAKVTDNPNQISRAGDLAGENYDLQKAEEARQEAQRKGEQQDKRSASAAESVAQKLENLRQQSELAAGSTQELSRDSSILRAQQSLGSAATQAQIQEAGQYAAKAWDAAAAAKGVTEALKAMPDQAENKAYTESMQNLKAALNAGKIDLQEYNAATEKMALEHQNNLAKINAQKTLNPVATARAEVDPIQQLVNENNQKLALMQQYQQQEQAILQQSYQRGKISYDQFIAAKSTTDAQYLALRTAQENQFNEQMTAAQWQLLSQQSLGYNMLTSAVDAFSGNASNAITGLLTGTMSAQEAMKSLGNTILNSVINSIVQVGVEMLKNFILSQTLGAAAQAANAASAIAGGAAALAAWSPAAIAASIATGGTASGTGLAAYQGAQAAGKAMSVLGARYNGGPVSAGGLYQVGEKGKPEIYQASTGKQYMIPGDNGKVISNKDMNGGQVQVNIQFYDQTSGGQHSFQAQAMQEGNVVTVDAFLNDLDRGGPMTSGIKDRFGLSIKANGAY